MAEAKEAKRISPEMKVLIGLGAGIVSLMILAATFASGFYAGWSGFMLARSGQRNIQGAAAAQQKAGAPGVNMPGNKNAQGQQKNQLQDKIKELGGTVIRGEVTAVNGNRITVTTQQGDTKTAVVTPNAVVQSGQQAAELSDISIGDRVAFVGSLNAEGTLQAKAVRILPPQGAPAP